MNFHLQRFSEVKYQQQRQYIKEKMESIYSILKIINDYLVKLDSSFPNFASLFDEIRNQVKDDQQYLKDVIDRIQDDITRHHNFDQSWSINIFPITEKRCRKLFLIGNHYQVEIIRLLIDDYFKDEKVLSAWKGTTGYQNYKCSIPCSQELCLIMSN